MDDWKIGSIRVTRILEMCDPLQTPSEWFPDRTNEALGPHLHWLTPRSMSPATGRLILPISRPNQTPHNFGRRLRPERQYDRVFSALALLQPQHLLGAAGEGRCYPGAD